MRDRHFIPAVGQGQTFSLATLGMNQKGLSPLGANRGQAFETNGRVDLTVTTQRGQTFCGVNRGQTFFTPRPAWNKRPVPPFAAPTAPIGDRPSFWRRWSRGKRSVPPTRDERRRQPEVQALDSARHRRRNRGTGLTVPHEGEHRETGLRDLNDAVAERVQSTAPPRSYSHNDARSYSSRDLPSQLAATSDQSQGTKDS